MTRWKAFKDKSDQCYYCRKPVVELHVLGIQMTVDHVLPKSRGGGNESTNLVTACEPCNNCKSDSTEWYDGCVAIEAFGNPEWYRDILLQEEEMKGKRKNGNQSNTGIKRNNGLEGSQRKWRYDGWHRSTNSNSQEL